MKWTDSIRRDRLAFLIVGVSRSMRRRFDARARDLGLSRAQWMVLAQLTKNEGIRQAALAELVEIEPITLSRHVDRMEAAGLVERRADPSDRRVRCLYLTEPARPILDRMWDIANQLEAEMLEGVSKKTVDQVMNALGQMLDNLNDGRDERASAPQATSRKNR